MSVKPWTVAALVMCGAALAPGRGFAGETIYVANAYDVTAYPADANGDVAPISLTTDMSAPSGIARDTGGNLYVSNAGSSTVTIYAAGGNGNVAPIAVIGGPDTGLSNPIGVAIDASGRIYVLNSPQNSRGYITVYPALGTSSGILDEAPTALIGGGRTLLKSPDAIAVDARGEIFIANQKGGPTGFGTIASLGVGLERIFSPGMVTIYAPGSNGNVAPSATIRGYATGLVAPISLAVDSDDDLYVGNAAVVRQRAGREFYYPPSITVYAAGATGDAPPLATIAGSNTALGYPIGLAVDASRNIYATDADGPGVNDFAAGSNGNVPPAAYITGTATGLSDPDGIAVDAGGNMYVANGDDGASVTV